MLVLTRKEGQSIIIDGKIKITFLEHKPGCYHAIRLGIEAPPEVSVWREELWVNMQDKKEPEA